MTRLFKYANVDGEENSSSRSGGKWHFIPSQFVNFGSQKRTGMNSGPFLVMIDRLHISHMSVLFGK